MSWGDRPWKGRFKPRFVEQLLFLLLMGGVFAWAAWEARTFPERARLFPQIVAGAAVLLTLLALVRDLRRGDDWEGYDGTPFLPRLRAARPFLLWIGGYYLGIWVLGFLPATGLFVFLFLRWEGGVARSRAGLAAGVLLAGIVLLRWLLELRWPEGLLERIILT